jgi:hypothetical protein
MRLRNGKIVNKEEKFYYRKNRKGEPTHIYMIFDSVWCDAIDLDTLKYSFTFNQNYLH